MGEQPKKRKDCCHKFAAFIDRIITLPAVALLFVPLFSLGVDILSSKLGKGLDDITPLYMLIPSLVAVLLILKHVLRRLGGCPKCSSWCVRPPVWMASIAGCFYYYCIRSFLLNDPFFDGLPYLLALLSTFFILLLPFERWYANFLRWLAADEIPQTNTAHATTNTQPNTKPYENIERWIENDKPVTHPDADLFQHAGVARRIARILREPNKKTIGLLGPFGCGKSSILNFVKYYLDNSIELEKAFPSRTPSLIASERLLWCRLGDWGVEKGQAAQSILRAALHKVTAEVDCVACVTLPNEYSASLGKNSWGIALVELLTHRNSPEEALGRLDDILASIGKRLVIVIEDADRNPGGPEAIAELCALLDRLMKLDNITFVVACRIEDGISRDLVKILEHIEYVPVMDSDKVSELVGNFICLCWTRADANATILRRTTLDTVPALLSVVNVPRHLKSVLSTSWEVWRGLAREIDLDDVLFTQALRIHAPEAYGFVAAHLKELREEPKSRSEKEIEKHLSALYPENKLIKQQVGKMIKFLFLLGAYKVRLVVQGIGLSPNKVGTDYWARLHAGELAPDEISDQEIQKLYYGWSKGPSSPVGDVDKLPKYFLDVPGFDKRFFNLNRQVTLGEVEKLIEDYLETILTNGAKRDDEDYCGFTKLWEVYFRLITDDILAQKHLWIVGWIERAIETDFRLALRLCGEWNLGRRRNASLAQTLVLREAMVTKFKTFFKDNPDRLAGALNDGFPNTLSVFIFGMSKPENGGPGFENENWREMGSTFLDAARMSPEIMIPKTSYLVVEAANNETQFDAFSESRATAIFGTNMRPLMKALVQDIPESDNPIVRFAQKYAREWLSRHNGEEGQEK